MTAPLALNVPHSLKLTAPDFLLLAANDAFAGYARSELIGGEIIVVNAQFRRHANVRRRLVRALERALDGRHDGLGVTDECSVALSDAAVPQPDITISTEPEGEGPIPAAAVRLLVEIADTTSSTDLGEKAMLYAAHHVPEYWVVDLPAGMVHRMWQPGASGFDARDVVELGARIESATISGLVIETDEIK